MRYTIQKILEFHDLFPEENDLDERVLLTKYNREYIVRCCHVLCNNYGNAAFIPDTKNTFFSDVSKKYISDLNNRISKYFNSSRQNRICYCTIKSALELMRVAFSIPMQNLWLLSKIGCNSLLHIGLFATNERHFDVRVTDG